MKDSNINFSFIFSQKHFYFSKKKKKGQFSISFLLLPLIYHDIFRLLVGISTPNSIKLRFNNTERLIALQQLHTNQVVTSIFFLKVKF